ncbi:MAG: hypothetical protein JRJ87_08110 [Deltaproteobacteria bacterium]|nr:hypothetical protein [Deltaproteobacteria bacterium]
MGKTAGMPNYRAKQNLLFGKEINPQELSRIGREFLKAGWLNDAIDFLAKGGDDESLIDIRARAIEEGDVFIFRRVLKATGTTAEEKDWREIGDCALLLEKLQFAREAYRMAGDRKAMDKIDSLINPSDESALEEPRVDQSEES